MPMNYAEGEIGIRGLIKVNAEGGNPLIKPGGLIKLRYHAQAYGEPAIGICPDMFNLEAAALE